MPQVGVGTAGSGDDLEAADEIKVFKTEGEEQSKENLNTELTELKTSLVTEFEEDKSPDVPGSNDYGSPSRSSDLRPDSGSHSGKAFDLPPSHSSPLGYVVPPYVTHHNGPAAMDIFPEGCSKSQIYQFFFRDNETRQHLEMARTIDILSSEKDERDRERENYYVDVTRALAGKVSMVPPPPHSGSPLPFMVYNGEHFAQPPPAHMGIPPVAIDPKTGLRPPVYLGPPGQYPPVFSHEFPHQLQWHTPSLYSTAASAGFRSAYSSALPVSSGSLPRFTPPTLISPYAPGISHPALIPTGPGKQDISLHHPHHPNHRSLPDYPIEQKYNPNNGSSSSNHSKGLPGSNHSSSSSGGSSSSNSAAEKKTHIKKPLNAFMLYMKEMRAKVVAECTLKESAAINQILGRRWHSLTREEQAKYYEMARKERQIHMQLYPGWSARDNYALQVKKKKRKKDRTQEGDGNNLKKCRARFGLDQQSSWCKPCRRKKKCIRYKDGNDGFECDDNMGSAGSVEAPTPDSNHSDDSDSQDSCPPLTPVSLPPPPPPQDIKPPPSPYHPLSVHQLIQPHFSSRATIIGRADRISEPMLTVT